MVKWTVLIGLWRKYKQHLLATIILLFGLLLINVVHQDFLAYAETTNTANVGWSFAIKWLLFLVAIASYVWRLSMVNKRASFDSTLHKMMQAQQNQSVAPSNESEQSVKGDPFESIRNKKKLSSEADFIIGKDK